MGVKKKDIEAQFKLFVAAIGGRVSSRWDDVGSFQLDYSPICGGYLIGQVWDNHGSISYPFGKHRIAKKDFYHELIFATKAFELKTLTDNPLFAQKVNPIRTFASI